MSLNSAVLRPASLVDALQDAVRNAIFDGQITPGETVTESFLSSTFGVARPTARGALERLIQDGLLVRSFNRPARVPVLDSDDIRDLYFSRAILERDVVRHLAEHAFLPKNAMAAHQSFQRAIDDVDTKQLVISDIQLHRSLVESNQSPRLARMYGVIMGEVQLCMAQVQARHPLSAARIADEHGRVLNAIEAGDVDEAINALDTHLSLARDHLIANLGTG